MQTYLLKNACVFDGRNDRLSQPVDVLVEGNKIARIAESISAPDTTTLIDARGYTMTPGFIDAHSHIMLQMSFAEAFTSDEFYWAYVSVRTAKTYLSRGFTTIREVGGNAFSLKKAIDRGIMVNQILLKSCLVDIVKQHHNWR